jgi:predicted acyl esterase
MGYYGDSTAIGYFNEFRRYKPGAQSYLVAGPWDHFGSQQREKPAVLRGYRIDPVAQIDTWQLTFDWFDYVLGGKPRPALLRDRVNVEVMGENFWRHVPSLQDLGEPQRLYFSAKPAGPHDYLLASTAPGSTSGPARALHQKVDLADRRRVNNDSYPYLIVGKKLDVTDGYTFLTPPFPHAEEVSGLDGVVHLRSNKRDLDVGLALYEVLPDGQLLQLTYYTQRASLAADNTTRHLLTPSADSTVPFEQDYLFSRLIAKGSRLLLTVDVNKNSFAQINYGTGKDVSTEDIHDADVPLQVDWLTDSYIQLRLHSPAAVHSHP